MNKPRTRRLGALAAIGSAGLVAGALLLGTTAAHAASSTPSPSSSASTSSPTAPARGSAPQGTAPQGHPGPGGSSPVRSDEKALTADQSATLSAAAAKAVPGGTVVRVETDAGDAAFEVHMTKADGTVVTVKFDHQLAVVKVEDGMGLGDPQMGPPPGTAAGATQGSTATGTGGTTGASGASGAAA